MTPIVWTPEPLPIGTRVIIERSNHPWAGHSGTVCEHIGGNPYITHEVALDNGFRAGARRGDLRVVPAAPERKKKRRKRR